MLRTTTAKNICVNWHGGQWSALYQFASSASYTIQNHLRYLQEIESDLHPEYNLYPGTLSKKDESDLIRLKEYFLNAGNSNGIITAYYVHEDYGYKIPYIVYAPNQVLKDITNLQYAI